MLDLSVIVVLRDLRAALDRLLPELCRKASQIAPHSEILCVDSTGRAPGYLREELLRLDPRMRLLAVDPPQGPSVALGAGLAAARAETIAAIEGTGRYTVDDLTRLLPRLARADAVFGCRRRGPVSRLVRSLVAAPRRLLLGIDVRDPGCLLWVARREAVEGFELFPGAYRLLPAWIAARGFRVAELHVNEDRRAKSLGEHRSLAALWSRRAPAFQVHEFASPPSRVAA
jgi:hypothetical protein